jgi:hypothetical protein
MCAASGSMMMLNSATGLQLPSWKPPPISTTSRTRSTILGSFRTAMAMLVNAPVGTRVIESGGCAITVSMIRSTACRGSSSLVGSRSRGPSMPLSPWMDGATSTGRTSGREQPAAIGTPVMPMTVATERAFRVTFSSVWLPATVVTATTSMSGLPWARSSATASSCPGSQSRMTFLPMAAIVAQPIGRYNRCVAMTVRRSGRAPASRSAGTAATASRSGARHKLGRGRLTGFRQKGTIHGCGAEY